MHCRSVPSLLMAVLRSHAAVSEYDAGNRICAHAHVAELMSLLGHDIIAQDGVPSHVQALCPMYAFNHTQLNAATPLRNKQLSTSYRQSLANHSSPSSGTKQWHCGGRRT